MYKQMSMPHAEYSLKSAIGSSKSGTNKFDGSCSNWDVRCDKPDAAEPVWTETVYIGFGASLNKPIVRKNGEWILPVSFWERWHIDKPLADCYHELECL